MKDLGIEGFAAYRKRLDTRPEEWKVLDGLTHITISRFFRDKSMKRAHKGCYTRGSLRELAEALFRQGFEQSGSLFCVRQRHREGVSFVLQDLRSRGHFVPRKP